MATFNLGNVPSPINQALRLAQLREAQNPNLALERQIQQAVELQRIQQQSPEGQLQAAIGQAKLQELQNPELALQRKIQEAIAIRQATPVEVAGSLLQYNPETQKYDEVFKGVPKPGQNIFEVDGNLLERQPTGEFKNVFSSTKATKSPFSPQQVVNINDPTDVRFALPDEGGRPPVGYQFQKALDQPMKPSEKLTAQREIRNVYDELPAKIDLFGKGQVPGSEQVKTKLDALLKPAKGDFTKLNAQAKNYFVFAMSKLRDPTSAVLTTEASQIADRAGILDRLGAYAQNLKSGDQVTEQVAKDIYDVVSQVNVAHRENFVNSLIPLKEDTDSLNKKLTSLGVPKEFQDEVERRVSSSVATSGFNPNAPSPVRIPGISQSAQPSTAPAGKVRIIAPDGRPGFWPADRPIPDGFRLSQ